MTCVAVTLTPMLYLQLVEPQTWVRARSSRRSVVRNPIHVPCRWRTASRLRESFAWSSPHSIFQGTLFLFPSHNLLVQIFGPELQQPIQEVRCKLSCWIGLVIF